MAYNPNHGDAFLDGLDEELGNVGGDVLGTIGSLAGAAGGAMGGLGGAAGTAGQIMSMAGPLVNAIGNAIGGGQGSTATAIQNAASQAAPLIQGALGAATNTKNMGGDFSQMLAAVAPMMAGAVNKGGDAAVTSLIQSMPQQIKNAVREVVTSVREGDLSAKNARNAIVANVDATLHPKLATALSALEQQRLQTQATQEHRGIVRRDDFENTVTSKLERVERAVAALTGDRYYSPAARAILDPTGGR